MPIDTVNEIVREPLPSTTQGPYWIVGDQVRPHIPHDSKLFYLDTIPMADRTLVFIRKKPLFDERILFAWWATDSWVEQESTITGELKVCGPSMLTDLCFSGHLNTEQLSRMVLSL